MTTYRHFTSQPHTHARGVAAENAATRWLERQGYRILERNLDTPAGEIDLVAVDADTLCFIEIKARDNDLFGSPLEAVRRPKQARLARAAAFYLAQHPWPGPCRFDVLGLTGDGATWRFDLVQDAFQLPG